MLNRRSLLQLGLSTYLAKKTLPNRAFAAGDGLAKAAHSRERFFGAAVRREQLDLESDLRNAIIANCSYIVPETELKWGAIEPSPGMLSFENADALAAFAIANKQRIRGHTLIWHRSIPQWAEQSLRTDADWSIISRYFGSIIPRYGDVIDQWDVVNEPIDTGHRMDGLRESVFLDAFGPQYIDRALHEARSYAPRARLLLNEYGLEYNLPIERDRRYLLLKLVDRLKASGVPLDGLGLQAHLDLAKGHISAKAIASFLREIDAMGLAIVISELDVKESDYIAPAEVRDRRVADEVSRYLDVVLQSHAVIGVATWGISDRHSWLEVTSDDYARFSAAWSHGSGPGLNRGLPFDASMRPKPMYNSIHDALAAI